MKREELEGLRQRIREISAQESAIRAARQMLNEIWLTNCTDPFGNKIKDRPIICSDVRITELSNPVAEKCIRAIASVLKEEIERMEIEFENIPSLIVPPTIRMTDKEPV